MQLVDYGFGPNARWEILNDPDDNMYLDEKLEVDNITYRAPTTLREEF